VARAAQDAPQTLERRLLQLADAFTCHAEPVAGLAERVRLVAVEAEAQVQDGPQAWVQALERPGEAFAIVTGLGERERRGGRAVAETVEQTGARRARRARWPG